MTALKKMRKQKGISQAYLASRAGVSQPTLCKQERVGLFNLLTAKKYAKVLKCKASGLLENID